MSPTMLAFLENETALKRFLGRILPISADVEDIAQEAFLRAFVASSTETVLMPKAFLFRIARNLAFNERSRMWNTTTTLVGDSSELDGLGADEGVSSEERLDSHRKMQLFSEAISHLPTKCRHVFLLRKVHELSHKDIADQMGISVSTVEKHIAMGLDRCSQYLRERGYDVGVASIEKSLELADRKPSREAPRTAVRRHTSKGRSSHWMRRPRTALNTPELTLSAC
jgi:RNA polymerase sigma factor (sigma-70 family)